MAEPPTVELLQASVSFENESYFRMLIDGKIVKYLTIDGGVYSVDDMCFGPALVSLLPPLPPGDWKEARISRDAATGDAHFAEVSATPLPGITATWHATCIDHLELRMGRQLRSNVYEATCDRFSAVVVVKFARFAWEIPQLAAETAAYAWIDGGDVRPAFLGHVTEQGRVMGFVLSRVVDGRHATPADWSLCHEALLRLHRQGIRHGDTNKHNFLIHEERATLIDFDNAARGASAEELQAELDGLFDQLRDTSGRGGRVVESGEIEDWQLFFSRSADDTSMK